MKIAVSFLKSDNYKKCIQKINNTSADYLHVDMCDGKYVETKNFTIKPLIDTLSVSTKKLDVHLMCDNPISYVDDLAILDVETITFHLNTCKDPMDVINYIHSIGIKVGMAINPDEQVEQLTPYLEYLDEVLVMSVVPGKGGQSFMGEVLPKVDELNNLKSKYHFIVAIDGGINGDTVQYLKDYPVDMAISGSYVTLSESFEDAIRNLHI